MQKIRAIDALMRGASHTAAAEEAGVSRRTLYDWRHTDEHFMAELDRRREMLWEASADRLRALLPSAISALASDVANKYRPTRMRAAQTILRLANLRCALPIKKET